MEKYENFEPRTYDNRTIIGQFTPNINLYNITVLPILNNQHLSL